MWLHLFAYRISTVPHLYIRPIEYLLKMTLTHWGRVTHVCVSKLTIIGSNNGLSPGRSQAIIWTNAGILLIRTLGTNFSEMLSEILTVLSKKNAFERVVCEIAAILSRPQCVDILWNMWDNKITITDKAVVMAVGLLFIVQTLHYTFHHFIYGKMNKTIWALW